MDFSDWLTEELNSRGWTYSELARRAEISHSTVSTVVSRASRPGPDFCLGIARAFSLPPEEVFRKAGLLPSLVDDKLTQEIQRFLHLLPKDDQATVLRIIKGLVAERSVREGGTESK